MSIADDDGRYVPISVSIHVLRRGRCVQSMSDFILSLIEFQSTSSEEDVVSSNLSPTRRLGCTFQSTSSEEDVVSTQLTILYSQRLAFQSTSSEEDVVSFVQCWDANMTISFNPRPPKRTLCQNN